MVLVATMRALKYNGGVPKADLLSENVEALRKGPAQPGSAHREHDRSYGVPVVVAINRFGTDTDAEIAVLLRSILRKERRGLRAVRSALPRAAKAAVDLAKEVVAACEEPGRLPPHL